MRVGWVIVTGITLSSSLALRITRKKTLAHLRMGHTYAQLTAGFDWGTTTAYCYTTEAVKLLAALTPA